MSCWKSLSSASTGRGQLHSTFMVQRRRGPCPQTRRAPAQSHVRTSSRTGRVLSSLVLRRLRRGAVGSRHSAPCPAASVGVGGSGLTPRASVGSAVRRGRRRGVGDAEARHDGSARKRTREKRGSGRARGRNSRPSVFVRLHTVLTCGRRRCAGRDRVALRGRSRGRRRCGARVTSSLGCPRRASRRWLERCGNARLEPARSVLLCSHRGPLLSGDCLAGRLEDRLVYQLTRS